MFKKIWNWYNRHFLSDGLDAERNIPLEELRWMPKDIYTDKHEPFGYIDSIQFDIEKIKSKEEIILELESKEKAQEVIAECVHRI